MKRARPTIAVIPAVIAAIDAHITNVINNVLHHPALQKCEALWRNLYFLVSYAPLSSNIKIKILTLTFSELSRDVTHAIEFDQSELFGKIYSEEFGMPGGEPFGFLLGDYDICLRYAHHIDTLRAFSEIAAAAFVPFIVNVDASSFGINTMNEFEKINDIEQFFKLPEFSHWNRFRQNEHASFIGLTFPKTLMRKPYGKRTQRAPFLFSESLVNSSDYLWGGGNFSFATTILTAFKEQGWFNALRGLPTTQAPRGRVHHLPQVDFQTDAPGLAPKHIAEVCITDTQEKRLSEAGFIPLCVEHHTQLPIFYSDHSIQKPQRPVKHVSDVNANISVLMQYLLCACRFAHYVKIIGRNKMGTFLKPADCEHYLNQWLLEYTVSNDDLSWEQQAKYPLKKAHVIVNQRPGMPGHFNCVIHVEPRFYVEQIESTFLLMTELAATSIQ